MKDRRQLPALEKSTKVKNPDLNDISNKNYTDTILKYGGLATKFPQLNTNANTLVAAINELYARPIAHNTHNVVNGGGSVVIANPLVGPDNVLGTSSEDYIVTNLDYFIQVYQGESAGLLYAISIDGYIYDVENVSECNIDELQNVNISGATNGQILQYNANKMVWENVDSSEVPSTLDDLTDVDIDSPQAGQALIYDALTGEWTNGIVSTVGELDDLEDVDITSVEGGQVLRYNQNTSKWENSDDNSGDIWEGTQEEYDAIIDKDPNTVYYITDAPAQTFNADAVNYDNSGTKLNATTVQSAIDEIVQTNIYWTDIISTLPAGSTSLQLHNENITVNSTVQVFVDSAFYGIAPTSITVVPQYVTLGFEAQSNNIPVKVRIS